MKPQVKELCKLRRDMEVEKLRNIGNPCRSRVFLSKKDKENDPKRQRKNWNSCGWE